MILLNTLVLLNLAVAQSTGRATWLEKRDTVLPALAQLKVFGPVDQLYPLLEADLIDDTLWRWSVTNEMPALRDMATRWLGLTDYSPARFSRLISEMERAISLDEPRAFDFMVAVAEMRQRSPAAAEQLWTRVRRGLPPAVFAHYARSRFEYELVPAPGTIDAIIITLVGFPESLRPFIPAPTDTERARAFAEALGFGASSELGAPAKLIDAMDSYLNLAPTPPVLGALARLREKPGGFEALLPRLHDLRVYHPERPVRRAAARAAFTLRGGVRASDLTFGKVIAQGPMLARQNLRAWREGFPAHVARACELMFYTRDQ